MSFFCCYPAEFHHIEADERRFFLELEHCDLELSSCEVHRVCSSSSLEQVDDLSGCDLFRVEEKVDAHFCEEVLVLVGEVLFVVDAGCDLLAAKLLCEHGADDVDVLLCGRAHCDEKVCMRHTGLLQHMNGRRIACHCHHVGGCHQSLKS